MTEFGLHRNVHPQHMDGLTVGPQAFSPTSEEEYQLSLDCERVWSAKKSYQHRTLKLGRSSTGVWTISRSVFQSLGIPINVDKTEDNPSHSLAVFPKERAKRRDLSRRLVAAANKGAFSLLK
ncbi:hypothetical protein [Roseibaca sp. Y0-43]|uniref:hypothetical protein n=1 Tax=Roseibaca sp. Y0-43 TaxID=2816854 RepID=UPI001D0C7BE0|nr:hypothetical protein [Roseibaca sp. Y0-43]MCC1482105.1 hypothetical protein [Roseibaca sp. Y0-43]